jgi:hypothetical protein
MPWKLWRDFARGFGLGNLALLVFFFRDCIASFVGHFSACNKDGCERCIFAKGGEAHPGFADGAAPGCIDDADGDVLARRDVAGKVPCDGGEIFGSIGRRQGPSVGIGVGHRIIGTTLSNHQQTNLRIGRIRYILRRSGCMAEWKFHVGLAGCNPDIANHNVVECDGLLCRA